MAENVLLVPPRVTDKNNIATKAAVNDSAKVPVASGFLHVQTILLFVPFTVNDNTAL